MKAAPLFLLALLPACAATPPRPTRFVKAHIVDDDKAASTPPAVVTVPKPMPLPGQLRPTPRRHDSTAATTTTAPSSPTAVVADANRKATSSPDPEGFYNAIMLYDYAPGAVYRVYTAPLRFTALQLQPGEHLVGKIIIGDAVRWAAALGKAQTGAAEQFAVYIKPTRPNLSTTLTINTDRRSYFVELTSWESDYMVAVAWRYPLDEVAQIEAAAVQQAAAANATTATLVRLDAANFGYSLQVVKGRPSWTPLQVFDDGTRTFVRFPKGMLRREAPAFFVLAADDQVQIVNVRVKNEYYVVDRLFERAELRVGQRDQEIVRIVKDR